MFQPGPSWVQSSLAPTAGRASDDDCNWSIYKWTGPYQITCAG